MPSITSRDDISDIVLALSTYCHQMKHLEVKYCQPLTLIDLSNLSKGCKKLQSMNLEGTGCLNGDMCQCGQIMSYSKFGEFKKLTELNLFLCQNLRSKGLELIAKVCVGLESLNIDEIDNLSDESINCFIELRSESIKHLWIDGESLCDESFGNFEKMKRLTILSVSFADNMGPKGLMSIAKLENLGRFLTCHCD